MALVKVWKLHQPPSCAFNVFLGLSSYDLTVKQKILQIQSPMRIWSPLKEELKRREVSIIYDGDFKPCLLSDKRKLVVSPLFAISRRLRSVVVRYDRFNWSNS